MLVRHQGKDAKFLGWSDWDAEYFLFVQQQPHNQRLYVWILPQDGQRELVPIVDLRVQLKVQTMAEAMSV